MFYGKTFPVWTGLLDNITNKYTKNLNKENAM